MLKTLLKSRKLCYMNNDKKDLIINSFIFYSLINRNEISLKDVMSKINDTLKDESFKSIKLSIDRKDVMQNVISWPLRFKTNFTDKDWTIEKITDNTNTEKFFTIDNIDKKFGEVLFENKETLEKLKSTIM